MIRLSLLTTLSAITHDTIFCESPLVHLQNSFIATCRSCSFGSAKNSHRRKIEAFQVLQHQLRSPLQIGIVSAVFTYQILDNKLRQLELLIDLIISLVCWTKSNSDCLECFFHKVPGFVTFKKKQLDILQPSKKQLDTLKKLSRSYCAWRLVP